MTAASLVHELMEARDERRLRALQKHLNTVKLLIVDELGYVPFTAVGSELLFEVFSQRYEHGSPLVTSNQPFDECDLAQNFYPALSSLQRLPMPCWVGCAMALTTLTTIREV